MKIGEREISNNTPPYIIAEMSGNHNGDINRALKLIDAAAEAGADAVKLQTYTADTLTLNSNKKDFRISEGLWQGKNLYQLYDWAHTPWQWHQALFDRANKLGIDIFSSPFDETAVDFLTQFDPPAYKIASFELIDHELVKKVAETKKPMIMSTGMANIQEIEEALAIALNYGNGQVTLLHCVSGYPTPIEQTNLATIKALAEKFDLPIGLSDHTFGNTTAIASVALGATVIEKHFTLARADGGPDAAFSLEPEELKALCKDVRDAWHAIGKPNFTLAQSEQPNLIFRRSLYISKDIKKGEAFSKDNVRCIRPGYGLAPKHLDVILGLEATMDIEAATALTWDMVNRQTTNI